MIRTLPEGTEEELTSWLWLLLAEAPEWQGEPDVLVQINDAYGRAPVALQETFKRAVARGIAEWQAPARDPSALRELLFLAARFRATEAVVPLCRLLERKKLWCAGAEPEETEAAATAIQLLAGFLPVGLLEVAQVLDRLYFSREVHPVLGASLFAALCRLRPASYPFFLGRYLELRRPEGGPADDALVFGFFVDTVPTETIQDRYPLLSIGEREFLVSWLRKADIAPLGLVFDFHDQEPELDFAQVRVQLQGASGQVFELEQATGMARLRSFARMTCRDSFVDRLRQLADLP